MFIHFVRRSRTNLRKNIDFMTKCKLNKCKCFTDLFIFGRFLFITGNAQKKCEKFTTAITWLNTYTQTYQIVRGFQQFVGAKWCFKDMNYALILRFTIRKLAVQNTAQFEHIFRIVERWKVMKSTIDWWKYFTISQFLNLCRKHFHLNHEIRIDSSGAIFIYALSKLLRISTNSIKSVWSFPSNLNLRFRAYLHIIFMLMNEAWKCEIVAVLH